MRIVHQKAELIQQESGLEGIYKQIESAARTCYKSENKITEDSAKGFVNRMIENKHLSMLEHGTVYLMYSSPLVRGIQACEERLGKYKYDPYSKCVRLQIKTVHGANSIAYVTTNLRVLVENEWMDDLKYLCEPDANHEKRFTFKLTTSIGIIRELIRHRRFSFANESTRYCNYSRDKFDNQVAFVCPSWLKLNDGIYDSIVQPKDDGAEILLTGDGYIKPINSPDVGAQFLRACWQSESRYFDMLEKCHAQQARDVLTLATKSDIVMTGFESDWRHFFDLRYFGTTGKPHPDMLELTSLMKEEAEKGGIYKYVFSH